MAPTDDEIRQTAKARVAFRRHLGVYLLMNVFLVLTWFLVSKGSTYWPLWVHLGWGLGVAFHGFHAYGSAGVGAVAREEEKLRRKHGMG